MKIYCLIDKLCRLGNISSQKSNLSSFLCKINYCVAYIFGFFFFVFAENFAENSVLIIIACFRKKKLLHQDIIFLHVPY